MDGRPGDGYEVRYRLDSPRTLRGVLAIGAVGLVVAAWLAATLVSPRPALVADADGTGAPGTDVTRPQATGPTFPPQIERRVPMDDLQIPTVGLDGLGWLDTRDGRVRHTDDGPEPRWLFLEADGSTLCVCVRYVEGGLPEHELRTYGPSGQPLRTVSLADWPSTFVARTVTDVVREPTNRFLYVAWAREIADERWTLGLDLVSREDGALRTTELTKLEAPGSLATPVDVRLWLSPDARHARIRFAIMDSFEPGASRSEGRWSWTVPIDGLTPGGAVPIHEPGMPDGTVCFAEGWATPANFFAACGGPGGTGDVITVRSSSLDGTVADVELPRGEELSWLASQTTGQLFLWAPIAHHIWRVDVPSLAVVERRFSPGDVDVAAGVGWPPPGDQAVAWLPRGWQRQQPSLDEGRLVGARDGAVVYAAGDRRTGPVQRDRDSTGVWAIDATTLALVDHWNPVGAYNSLALTPGGDQVIAVGGPTAEELGVAGTHGATIAFHDPQVDGISLILREVTSWPTFLVSEPPPEPT